MKKKVKISLCLLLIIAITISAICFKFYYPHNKRLVNFFTENETLMTEYIDTFNKDDFTDKYDDDELGEVRLFEIPKELKEKNVTEIALAGSNLFFKINDGGAYYGGIYYSFDDSYAQTTPISANAYDKDFQEVRKGILVKGKKNTGTDWYQTEKIADNWYYFEVQTA